MSSLWRRRWPGELGRRLGAGFGICLFGHAVLSKDSEDWRPRSGRSALNAQLKLAVPDAN